MEKTVRYAHVHFNGATVRRARDEFDHQIDVARESERLDYSRPFARLASATVEGESEDWALDTLDEFLSDYDGARGRASFVRAELLMTQPTGWIGFPHMTMRLVQYPDHCRVTVGAPTRPAIEAVHAIFTDAAPALRVDPPSPDPVIPRVFVGHGGASTAWSDLVNHLSHQHNLDVIAYETGSRSGHSIRDILDEMLAEATFAILVMTPEDEQPDGGFRARQNVVHEAGLFQGKLGFARALMVRQDGVEMLSNLDGIQYVRYASHIRETYGEILAAIRREFGAF